MQRLTQISSAQIPAAIHAHLVQRRGQNPRLCTARKFCFVAMKMLACVGGQLFAPKTLSVLFLCFFCRNGSQKTELVCNRNLELMSEIARNTRFLDLFFRSLRFAHYVLSKWQTSFANKTLDTLGSFAKLLLSSSFISFPFSFFLSFFRPRAGTCCGYSFRWLKEANFFADLFCKKLKIDPPKQGSFRERSDSYNSGRRDLFLPLDMTHSYV